jgi:CHAT domain-containing protein
MRQNEGVIAACAARLPIVFLNACTAGRGQLTLGPGGAGFPTAFTELGARAIIAPLWPVSKDSAPLVAEAIYQKAVEPPGKPLAEILADLRARSYDQQPFDDSWAAYCLFGDPCGKLQHVA